MYRSSLPDREATETGWSHPPGKRLGVGPVSARWAMTAVAFSPVPATAVEATEIAGEGSCDRWSGVQIRWLRIARFLRNSDTRTADERPRRARWVRGPRR